MFCEVERSYIEDGFNLYGLRACVSNFSDCLDLILDRIGPDDSDDSHLTQSACTLYGLIHARFIITAHGLDAMYNKYASKEFGTCPLVQCAGQPVLPVGLKDEIGADTVKIFCPKCQCVYHPPPIRSRSSHHGGSGAAGVDGAAFGTTFPHLFLMTFSSLVPDPLPQDSVYVPRVFGFRVHPSARQRFTGTTLSPATASAIVTRQQREVVDSKRRSLTASKRIDVGVKEVSTERKLLRDVSRPDAPASVVEATTINAKGGRKPFTSAASPLKQETDGNSKRVKSSKRKLGDSDGANISSSFSQKNETASQNNDSSYSKRRRKPDNN